MPKTDQRRNERIARVLPLIAATSLAICAVVRSQTVADFIDRHAALPERGTTTGGVSGDGR